MPANPPDHSGVLIPPPILYALPLAAGLLLHRAHPIATMPHSREIASHPCFFRSTFQTPSYPSISRLPGWPVIPSF
jgi:hypothetical protein